MQSCLRIFKSLEESRDEIIDLQRELTARVALGPENGGSGEHEKAGYVKRLLEALKPDFLEEVDAPDERVEAGYRPNLLAVWNGAERQSSTWVLSHSDIVPPGDLALWQGDPYKIRVAGDRIYGRGVEDNQHGIVSSYLAVKAVLKEGSRPPRGIALAIVADEETGSGMGLQYVLSNRRDLFRMDDMIVVPDFGNEEGTMIEVAEKSMLWLRFTLLGKQCHASTPGNGRNTLRGAAHLIVALDRLKESFPGQNDLFTPTNSTFEPTKVEANVPNVNTIPGRDVFYLDCRVLPEVSLDHVIRECEAISQEIGSALGLEIKVDIVTRNDAALPTPADAPVVKALSEAIKEVTGKDARPTGIGGGTVAAFFRKAGLPVAVWSTLTETIHQPNEYCLISNIIADSKMLARLFIAP
ncbi:MAG: diaminopimelate aminotransferase [Deltaproteobacteria bacterium CG_4_8_14_3_um_filter_51_11]|nr:M20 family metallo-hydrolase [bacterium]OIP40032.1 MAG: diaminopimelate aminotransferase [Desulfobacteraceae bacterium CG2_30_51_40]PIP45112.1 MAG: diaminopimelate aminotransferase [Deltaproteobacteria bacterium CG23_combo_of_CG06-09_8_20_14_all_51_20]PIX19420.1 MAG: diaminopimelate aminotransferase [Deltaproteobacteria bacterium CG_4_8_14_3_um_filter_51_11]PIY26029.1 MAG: diaminopimelate aminotransferase [Deltaproteobacteria bacterium CG_4_10_14_3_um_filter_51_14]PJB33406.1 MAG: diaminopim